MRPHLGTGIWLAAGKKVAGDGYIGGPDGGIGLMISSLKFYVYGSGDTADGSDLFIIV